MNQLEWCDDHAELKRLITSIKNGKREDAWGFYLEYGQLLYKGNRQNGRVDGAWVGYNSDGTVNKEYTGTFKDGKKISD